MGVGSAITEKKHIEEASAALAQITGQKAPGDQKPSRRSPISACEGLPIGCKVTLRGVRMYEFLDRLISLALLACATFAGSTPTPSMATATTAWDSAEQLVFPELNPDKFLRAPGVNVTIVITGSKGDDESRELLRGFGMPFKVEEAQKGKAGTA